jgi:UDP-3-O-[3-hydroxymyristoyl] N-acetylglucosamine deacetylase
LNNELLKALLADAEAWEEVSFGNASTAPISYAEPAQAA